CNASSFSTATALTDHSTPSLHDALPISGSSQVTVSWSGVTDAGSGLAPAPYKLFSSTTDFPASCTGTPLFSGSQISFTHSSLTNGTTYFYRLCATDNAGNTSSGITEIGRASCRERA